MANLRHSCRPRTCLLGFLFLFIFMFALFWSDFGIFSDDAPFHQLAAPTTLRSDDPRAFRNPALHSPPPPSPIGPPEPGTPLLLFAEPSIYENRLNSTNVFVEFFPEYSNNVSRPLAKPHIIPPENYRYWPMSNPIVENFYPAWVGTFFNATSISLDGPYTNTHFFRTKRGCNLVAYKPPANETIGAPIASPRPDQNLHFNGTVVLLSQVWANSYYHYVVESLSRLMMVYDRLRTDPGITLLRGSTQGIFGQEYIDLLGLASQTRNLPLSWRHPVIFASEMLVPAPIPCGSTVPRLLARLRDVLFARMAERGLLDPGDQRRGEIVVIKRTGPREVTNHAEVMQALRREFGGRYRVTEFGSAPLAEAINTFRHARLIAGPHGAGLANMIFASPGTPVVEFQKEVPNACFAKMATTMGLPYWGFQVPGATQAGPMTVNVTLVVECARAALSGDELVLKADGLQLF
ncbi:hypothetical protein PAPYR_8577 [Paratrimastix pyriformis]|uniref:Glycosyltransferase 61 catalytic domain-containing protein n=1 Tax=Paratrimastix pyriformis TaxID=342808 RepID=A0ABQ8UAE5_9EUKA|nr:hypothetical protein PAPYR_8577 [Paratrimastix pyriformis]